MIGLANGVQLIDMVFPGDTNHHGTLFGGVALAHMDKIAFIAASRHGRATFVTASCERIDFSAPARRGEIVEATARVQRVGRRSVDVEIELVAEALLSGERRLCTRGSFTMVAPAVGGAQTPLPPLSVKAATTEKASLDPSLRMVEMVFPSQTNHYATLYGGDALAMMGKAAFIASTRHVRSVMVMAASKRIDFRSPILEGQMVELVATIARTGKRSVTVQVELWGEHLTTGQRNHAASAEFVMVSVCPQGRSCAFGGSAEPISR